MELKPINFKERLKTHPKDCEEDECIICGYRDCQYKEPLHYHHDGCPACYNAEVNKSLKDFA
ncbi:hypothetical protein LCGC14_0465590 [marine sediment metagenome]|uniref:Uncharacterized protein n=1 Tax=marine sediment metagenome TaxID=412755 RepID=A0A0F9SDR9_9ZZZZ